MSPDHLRINELKGKLALAQDDLAIRIREVEELERWKREAQQVEAEWDANKVAELLGAPLGSSSRLEIMRRVTHLVEYVKALETAGDAVASAVWKVQDWSDTRVGMTVDEWEKVRVGKEAKP